MTDKISTKYTMCVKVAECEKVKQTRGFLSFAAPKSQTRVLRSNVVPTHRTGMSEIAVFKIPNT